MSQSKHSHMAAKSLLLSLALQKPKAKPALSSDDPSLQSLTEADLVTVKEILAEVDKIKQW